MKSTELKEYQPHIGRTLCGLATVVALLWLLAFFFD